jgi:hypothetical protein
MKIEITWSAEPDREPDKFTPHLHTLFPQDPAYCYPSFYV